MKFADTTESRAYNNIAQCNYAAVCGTSSALLRTSVRRLFLAIGNSSVRPDEKMWIVRLALRRPYSFVVLALLLLILGPLVILRTPTDILPNVNIPGVSIIWNYNRFNSQDMSDRIVSITERTLTTTVDNIEHIESQSLTGIAVVKVFFQPSANVERAIAQITAISQTQLWQLPQGTTAPLVISYSASSVPILQLALSGQGLSEQQLNDFGLNFIRTRLITVPGATVPYPYGGKQRHRYQADLSVPIRCPSGLLPVSRPSGNLNEPALNRATPTDTVSG